MAAAIAADLRSITSDTVPTAEMAALRNAQRLWIEKPVSRRLEIIKQFRRRLAANGLLLARTVSPMLQRSISDTLSAEVIPVAEAARFLELYADRLLRPTKLSNQGRPAWLSGVEITEHREPYGIVLVIAPSNYPLLLPGVQVLQALVAGNAVIWKPGADGLTAAEMMSGLLVDAGLPRELLYVTDESAKAAQRCIDDGVDKVVLTGSAASGRSVLEQCAASKTPATVELSGCDAFFVLPSADVKQAARALVFGLNLNGGATCIAPRRVFVDAKIEKEFQAALTEAVRNIPQISIGEAQAAKIAELVGDAIAQGARMLFAGKSDSSGSIYPTVIVDAKPSMRVMQADVFAPVAALMTVPSVETAVEAANACPYALGACIFGSVEQSRELARHINVGVVVINDMIVPTADPRLSFGGRKASGFGKTRGREGLLEMTVTKSVAVQHTRRLRHLEAPHPRAEELFDSYLRLRHGAGIGGRLRAIATLCRAAVNKNQV